MAKGPKYTIQAMRGVVERYRARRMQPPGCSDCEYRPITDVDNEPPPGYEEMHHAHSYISQCPEHNKPEYQWLHKVDIESAARWLVKRGNRTKSGVLVFETIAHELKKDLCG